jgi:hypothetical protein
MRTLRFRPEDVARRIAIGVEFAVILTLTGCGYALHTVRPAAQIRLKIVAASPEGYRLRLRIREPREYAVPADGRVTLDVPAYRPPCTLYLFGRLAVPNHSDPYTAKTLDVLARGKNVRQLSLKKVSALPLDGDRYRVLRLPPAE